MRAFAIAMCFVVGLALLVGCGGGSSSGAASPLQVTRNRIRKALGQSQMALVQAGFQSPGAAFSMNGEGTTGTSGGGFPMIGAFVRDFGSRMRPMGAGTRVRFGPPPETGGESTTGTSTGSGTGGDGG